MEMGVGEKMFLRRVDSTRADIEALAKGRLGFTLKIGKPKPL